jgi:hypothetical protein
MFDEWVMIVVKRTLKKNKKREKVVDEKKWVGKSEKLRVALN